MDAETIYEKKYPRVNPMEKGTQTESVGIRKARWRRMTLRKLIQLFCEDISYILLPKRLKTSRRFIRQAKEISKLYALDTKIERHFDRISVCYYFNCGGSLRKLNQVFAMADEIVFLKDISGYDLAVSLDFYTHLAIRKGKIIAP